MRDLLTCQAACPPCKPFQNLAAPGLARFAPAPKWYIWHSIIFHVWLNRTWNIISFSPIKHFQLILRLFSVSPGQGLPHVRESDTRQELRNKFGIICGKTFRFCWETFRLCWDTFRLCRETFSLCRDTFMLMKIWFPSYVSLGFGDSLPLLLVACTSPIFFFYLVVSWNWTKKLPIYVLQCSSNHIRLFFLECELWSFDILIVPTGALCIINMHAVLRKQYSRNSTKETVLRKQYSGNSIQETVLKQQYSENSTQETVLKNQYSGNSTQETVLKKQYSGNSTQETVLRKQY